MIDLRRVLNRTRWLREHTRTARIPAQGVSRGRVLLSYVHAPFHAPAGTPLPASHTQHWESLHIARTWSGLGLDVDVISYEHRWFRPRRPYDVVIDTRWNLERLAARLPDATTVLHADTAHTRTLVAAERARLDALAARRGVQLQPRRAERPNRAIEHADVATVLGNEVTLATYAFAQRPLHALPLPALRTWDAPAVAPSPSARPRVLWLGSAGMVHKGLDLVLEALAGRDDVELVVGGPVAAETDFCAAYAPELAAPNVEVAGWLDVTGEAFARLAAGVTAMVYPTSSEGCAGAVVSALHVGLPVIATPQCGVDLDPAHAVAVDGTVEGVRHGVTALLDRSAAARAAMREAAWSFARSTHTRQHYSDRYRAVAKGILSGRSSG